MRRDALSGLLTGGFLVAVIAVVLAIILAAPHYAEPALAAEPLPDAAELAVADPRAEVASVDTAAPEVVTSRPPTRLKNYAWPVKGGMVASYYEHDDRGDFQIGGKRVHDGIVITWFEGAVVKAAHNGRVVAAGRDWARHVGFDGLLDAVYERYATSDDGKSRKPKFPMGVVVDDRNGYYSVYTEIKDLLVAPGDKIKAGQPIGYMSRAEGKQMMRYRLVRMDGPLMRVSDAARERGYPGYARERVDPLVVLGTNVKRMPQLRRNLPANPPRLSEY